MNREQATQIIKQQASWAEREHEGTMRLLADVAALREKQRNVVHYPFGMRECDHGVANHLSCGQCEWAEYSQLCNEIEVGAL